MDFIARIATRRRLPFLLILAAAVAWFGAASSAQQSTRGTITGQVTADQGEVRAFRVMAHNLDNRLWYTVFTNKGQYTVPQALPGRYEISVNEPGFASPKVAVVLGASDRKTADIVLSKRTQPDRAPANGEGGPARKSTKKIVYVESLEQVYPPGPGLDLLKENCIGCHRDAFAGMNLDREGFMRGIERAVETGPGFNNYAMALGRTPFTRKQKELMADYLAAHFGPNSPDTRIRLEPAVLDESVASKAIYVSYDIPEDLPLAPGGPQIMGDVVDGEIDQRLPEAVHHLQAAVISPIDGSIWYSSRASSSILHLNPKELNPEKRWEDFPILGDPYTHPSGIAIDKQGRVYWAELRTGRVGELDPKTKTQVRHALPQQAGAVLQVVVDKDQNVGFSLIWGAFIGRLDAVTRKMHMYPTPTPDNGMYGLAADQRGNLWGAGWQKGTISKWDAESQSITEYKVPSAWGQIRRVGVDSKGIVWGSAFNTGDMVRLDPSTGKLTNFRIPFNGAQPYDAWPDSADNVWTADHAHSAIIKLDPARNVWTTYPMPQPRQSLPKLEIAEDGTMWFGTRGVANIMAVHFYPNGYTAQSPPMP